MTTYTIHDKPSVSSVNPTADEFPVWQGSGQKKATAAQIVASVPMPTLPAGGLTITVGSGGDYATLTAARVAIETVFPTSNNNITINVLPGVVSEPDYIYWPRHDGKYIGINGTTYTTSITSVQSSSGSTGTWSIILNVASVDNIAIGDYISCLAPSGGTLTTYLAGLFKVTNVDAVNTRITVSSTHKAVAAPSGAVSGSIKIYKSIVHFTGTSGFLAWDGGAILYINNVVVEGDGTASTVGIDIQDLGRVSTQGFGVANFATGIFVGNSNSNLQSVAVSGCTGVGYLAGDTAQLGTDNCVSSGNGSHGFDVSLASSHLGNTVISTGNGGHGFRTSYGCGWYVASAQATGNALWGHKGNGINGIADIVTGSNNGYGLSNYDIVTSSNGCLVLEDTTHKSVSNSDYSDGIIYKKGGSTFIHDFNYGNNGTVTTEGFNLFLGNSGNLSLGATATQTWHGSYNIAFGNTALGNLTTGYANIAFGVGTLMRVTTGYENVGLGGTALNNLTTGYNNIAINYSALTALTTGHDNIAFGVNAGSKISGGSTDNTTGNTSIFIGNSTRPLADGDANEIVVGDQTTGHGANTATIGNASVTDTYLAGVVHSKVYTVATLPSASTAGAGARAFVSDANATTFNSVVAGSGSNGVPVCSDGTNWRIG